MFDSVTAVPENMYPGVQGFAFDFKFATMVYVLHELITFGRLGEPAGVVSDYEIAEKWVAQDPTNRKVLTFMLDKIDEDE